MDENPFIQPIINGEEDLVLDLLNNGADVNRRWTKTFDDDDYSYQYTVLHFASGFGSLRMARIFLDHGADIEATDSNGDSPLAVACRHLQPEVAELLVSRGANIDRLCAHGFSPFHLAVGDLDGRFDDDVARLRLVEVLINAGANVEATTTYGWKPLHIVQGREAIALLLVEHGANVNAVVANRPKRTPLHIASSHDQPQIIHLLLDHGANIDDRDFFDTTPLHISILKGNLGCAEVLVDRGADIFSTSQGVTPFKMAIAEGNLDIVFVLLRKDPIRILENEIGQGVTPFKMAIAEGNLDIVFVLLRKDPIRILENERGQPYFGG